MRIAVCGPHRAEVISNVESSMNTTAKQPWSVNGESSIIDYAADTYKYFNESNVIFDGSAFDFLAKSNAEGYDDVYEQIAIDTLSNLNYIAVIAMGMDNSTLNVYKEYQKLFPGKIYIYSTPAEFELRLM